MSSSSVLCMYNVKHPNDPNQYFIAPFCVQQCGSLAKIQYLNRGDCVPDQIGELKHSANGAPGAEGRADVYWAGDSTL